MKKLILVLSLTSTLLSCEKETATPNNTGNNNTSDTTKTNYDVTISDFDCAGVKISGTLTKDKVASNVTATITYTGGNGKTYLTKSHTSTGVTGLSATLLAGTLANGEGTLVYTISGTPTSSGTANFAIAFGGKTCSINVNIEDISQTIGKPGPTFFDAEGNGYRTVIIGTQTWMAENLKVSKYNDGTIIPNITDNTLWQNNTTGAWCYYNNDAANNIKYGKLYNWYAISPTTNGNKNVCPIGWHVPTDAEWVILTDYLGGDEVAGGKMKEINTLSWMDPNTEATNLSLFNGLPGGYLYGSSMLGFNSIGNVGRWWSTTENTYGDPWFRQLESTSGAIRRFTYTKQFGYSIRCLKD